MKTKKVPITLSQAEFRALLLRHADQDADKWVDGMKILLAPEDLAFIEELRTTTASPKNTSWI